MIPAKLIDLLQDLIRTPSFSGQESNTAKILINYLHESGVILECKHNNIWAKNLHFSPEKPTILLNSHHDTVKPNGGYSKPPFAPTINGDKLFGLGSNDAGGALITLLQVFLHFYDKKDMHYNLVLALTGEEENSGINGIRSILNDLPPISFAIVGEPTEMKMAIAEKGLLVIDAIAKGKSGHVAHLNTLNPIYIALEDIARLTAHTFTKASALLGDVKLSVSQISAGAQHNVVPAECQFVIDIRINENYTNEEVYETLDTLTKSTLTPRSFHLSSSSIHPEHPIVRIGKEMGITTYGSPTLSDQANLSCPSLKIGPGKSERSHQADEYIRLSELEEGLEIMTKLIHKILSK